MNNETHSKKLAPVVNINSKMKNLTEINSGGEVKTLNGFHHFLNGETRIIGYEGYSYRLDSVQGDKIETLSLRNGNDLMRSHATIISSHKQEEMCSTYIITMSDGTVIKANSDQYILGGTNTPILIKDLDTGDVVKSGVLRYENSLQYPSLNLGLNYVIEKRKIASKMVKVYEVHVNTFDNILVGQEMDGETSVLCLSGMEQKIA